MQEAPVSLLELNAIIKNLIKTSLSYFWVIAELSEVKVNYSGHCYIEFIQRDTDSDKIIARARGTIWASTFRLLKPYFETTTGQLFTGGIKVMVKVKIEYHEIYALSLNITDIEPTYTVGEIAVRKQKILQKLSDEGVIDMNKELDLNIISNRIAVISSKTAAGLKDFLTQLYNNSASFRFSHKLFPAVMQGDEAESSIINQLDNIFKDIDSFDCVVIIRGGGAQADMDCFNNYWLAYNITQFPIPVITGIGHEQDESVIDLIAHTKLKTPTAVAEFFIDRMSMVENNLLFLEESIVSISKEIINSNKLNLQSTAFKLKDKLTRSINNHNSKLNYLTSDYYKIAKNSVARLRKRLDKIKYGINLSTTNIFLNKLGELRISQTKLNKDLSLYFTNLNLNLKLKEEKIRLNNPEKILEKGYSITILNNKTIIDSSDLNKGDEIETLFYKGKIKSIIK